MKVKFALDGRSCYHDCQGSTQLWLFEISCHSLHYAIMFFIAAYDDPSQYQNQDASEIQEESDDSGPESSKMESEPVTPTSPGEVHPCLLD